MHPLVFLAHYPHASHRLWQKIRRQEGTLETLLTHPVDILNAAGCNPKELGQFLSWKRTTDTAVLENQLSAEGVSAIPQGDPRYPKALMALSDPPLCIFVRGRLPNPNEKALAVVGTRKCSIYGKRMTQEMVAPLAAAGVQIISGLALGIDGCAHYTALASGGYTLAVLAGGTDERTITPQRHQQLAKDILDSGGALLSEYPPGRPPEKYTFPARNRLIAALSEATLVTEAPQKSGALITAEHAMDIGKDVLAIPHQADHATGQGANRLLQEGAHLVLTAEDVAHVLGVPLNAPKKTVIPKRYAALITLLRSGNQTRDSLMRKDPSLLILLSEMEIAGLVYRNELGQYCTAH